MRPSKKGTKAPQASDIDRFGALPDELLHHVLSFLPAHEVVRTCVLARRWRHLWKSATSLRILGSNTKDVGPVEELRKFVDHLLILRGHADLNTFEIEFSEFEEEDVPYVNLWTRYAVLCKVRVLKLHLDHDESLYLDSLPLVSQHLRTLDLEGVGLQQNFLDFSSCPALEDMKMNACEIIADKISSRSLKHLSITGCRSSLDYRISISAPCLESFTLDGFVGRTPSFECMPLLETAAVKLGCACSDICRNYKQLGFCGAKDASCWNCLAYSDGINDTVLLGGIYNAKHLELISPLGMIIFARDLKRCPTFNKLKTLLLNDYWCVGPDFDALTCILKHSPVLEKLTLQLVSKGQAHKVEMKGSYCSIERSNAISKQLKTIYVKCNGVDERVLQLLKFMCTFNIRKLTGGTLHGLYILNVVEKVINGETPKVFTENNIASSTKLFET